jgi:hypothetical protein
VADHELRPLHGERDGGQRREGGGDQEAERGGDREALVRAVEQNARRRERVERQEAGRGEEGE